MASRSPLLVFLAALAVAVPSALTGRAWSADTGIAVRVWPAVGGPSTGFVVSFRAPIRTGVVGSERLRDLLSVTVRSTGNGCLAALNAPMPAARRGQRIRVRLDPARTGGRWCLGSYRGRVLELRTAICPPGEACPTYVVLRTIGRFSFTVRSGPGTDVKAPTFAGLERALACTPGPQRPGETTPYTLSWRAASDDVTPPGRIVYDVYYATRPGGENFARPTWTSPPGATNFRTPGLPSHGSNYFIVRARDAAGNEDTNPRELAGVDPCV